MNIPKLTPIQEKKQRKIEEIILVNKIQNNLIKTDLKLRRNN